MSALTQLAPELVRATLSNLGAEDLARVSTGDSALLATARPLLIGVLRRLFPECAAEADGVLLARLDEAEWKVRRCADVFEAAPRRKPLDAREHPQFDQSNTTEVDIDEVRKCATKLSRVRHHTHVQWAPF